MTFYGSTLPVYGSYMTFQIESGSAHSATYHCMAEGQALFIPFKLFNSEQWL